MSGIANNTSAELRDRLQQAIGILSASLQEQLWRYVNAIDVPVVGVQKYNAMSSFQRSFYQDFCKLFPDADLSAFHKLVMLELVDRFPERVRKIKIPRSVHTAFEREFTRIVQTIQTDESYTCEWSNDIFVKDFGICTFRMIPAGAQLAELSGIPRAWLINGATSRIQGLWYMLFKLKGTKPTYEIHTHTATLNEFSPDGWNRCYVRIGQLLKMNSQVTAMQGSSWFYDPALERISPHLSYLRQVPCANGAQIFYIGEEGKNSGALSKSKSRSELYEQGKYVPKAFLLVWPREQLIDFSERNVGLLDA